MNRDALLLALAAVLAQNAGCETVLGLDNAYRDGNGGHWAGGATSTDNHGGSQSPDTADTGGDASGGTSDVSTAYAGGNAATGTMTLESGGRVGNGGSVATGGVVPSGGNAAGGVTATGGAATGGAGSTGGVVSTGGLVGTGGGSMQGGTSGASGGESTGGNASVTCAGTVSLGLCWYLGTSNSSCTSTCSSHGGFNASATAFVGNSTQGGSLSECQSLLAALGVLTAPTEGTRTDGRGLGCHLYGQVPWWLTSPSFSPDAALTNVRIVCACNN